MDIGFDTIGNATLICYDSGPVLVTDPWLVGDAYFGSWAMAYEIPEEQMEAAKNCEYVWVSHGHPDHLSIKSLRLLKDKKILLPDHVGGRIAGELGRMGFNVTVLKDKVWTNLSPNINVLCIADYNQDGLLLIDVNGVLVADLNDTSPRGWGPFIQRTVRRYKHSFLLNLFGYGDADMINYFDEDGKRIEPLAALKLPVGRTMARLADTFGFTHTLPFSSLHKYQRTDSAWANAYTTPIEAYAVGFESQKCELLPANIRYDCVNQSFDEINPPESPDKVIDPKEFDDDWTERLEKDEFEKVANYFQAITHLGKDMDFINVRVGGEDNIVELGKGGFKKGIVFEAPKGSLMRTIKYEIFDDMLIGNFMKTSLVGKWPRSELYPHFTPFVSKYADNGRAKTPEELKKYFRSYLQRSPIDYLRHRIQNQFATAARTRMDHEGELYLKGKKLWWKINKYFGASV